MSASAHRVLLLADRTQCFVCLFGFLSPRQELGYIADGSQDWRQKILRTHEVERGDHDFCHNRGHIILTLTQPVESERSQRESHPRSLLQESRALPTELPFPLTLPTLCKRLKKVFMKALKLCKVSTFR